MRKIVFIVLILFHFQNSLAQFDSASIFIESKFAVGSQGYLPQWIGYNQYGLLDPNNNDGYLRGGIEFPVFRKGKFNVETGLDVVLKPCLLYTSPSPRDA